MSSIAWSTTRVKFLWGLWVDPLYAVLIVVTLVISGASQLYIRSTFARWDKIDNGALVFGRA